MTGNSKTLIQWLCEQDSEKIFEIHEKKPKRTLTANAYYWALVNQLSTVLRTSSDECHFLMLQRYGQYEVISVLSEIDLHGYFKYYKEIGHGTTQGKDFTHYKIYKRSSQMDSKEFSVLLDGVISECEQVGIPTLTPAEVASLKFIGGAE
jgi:hypothetical protein